MLQQEWKTKRIMVQKANSLNTKVKSNKLLICFQFGSIVFVWSLSADMDNVMQSTCNSMKRVQRNTKFHFKESKHLDSWSACCYFTVKIVIFILCKDSFARLLYSFLDQTKPNQTQKNVYLLLELSVFSEKKTAATNKFIHCSCSCHEEKYILKNSRFFFLFSQQRVNENSNQSSDKRKSTRYLE